MSTVQILHVPDSNPPAFRVEMDGAPIAESVVIPSPSRVQVVEGAKDLTLARELRKYLESYLDYAASPYTEQHQRTLRHLEQWGRSAFDALFVQNGELVAPDRTAPETRFNDIQVESKESRILAWPWEALVHPDHGYLGLHGAITRRIAPDHDSDAESESSRESGFERTGLNILLVIARPLVRDIDYRSVSRAIVDLMDDAQFPVSVHVLRPPTFSQLKEHLESRPHHYDVLHFDGHGSYGDAVGETITGTLAFEDDAGNVDPVMAKELSDFLNEHQIPLVVLNACRSAMADERADHPFASVALGLLEAGIENVVGMSYLLYVSGAQLFLSTFYQTLFETGDVKDAVSKGRINMASNKRWSSGGKVDFDDWLVPVHYQQSDSSLVFATPTDDSKVEDQAGTWDETEWGRGIPTYEFAGRDDAILKIERVMRTEPAAGILVSGMAGAGKTTLVREMRVWLEKTGGLHREPLWFNFDQVYNADDWLNQVGEVLFGEAFLEAVAERTARSSTNHSTDAKLDMVVSRLKATPLMMVWDNFESVSGIETASVAPQLDDADRSLLKTVLERLHGGKTTVLITSRSTEDWLGKDARTVIQLPGLQQEARWRLTADILENIGASHLMDDASVHAIVDELDGNPLTMQAVLSQLTDTTPEDLLHWLQNNIEALDTGTPETDRLFATLRFVEDSLPEDVRDLLIPLSMHERFVHATFLAAMCGGFERSDVERLLTMLRNAGLVQHLGFNIYSVHPMLTSYLRGTVHTDEAWKEAFVEGMAHLADQLAPKPLHEQRGWFSVLEPSFARALEIATEWTEEDDAPDERLVLAAALAQSLAVYAQNMRQWDRAETLYDKLAVTCERRGDESGVARAYHQLGIVAEERRDFASAEQWYRKSLEVTERLGDEHGAARAYHQLGIVSEARRDFAAAEQWYKKALAIFERQGNEHGAATTYGQLGNLALEQRDFASAEQWYRRAVAIFERQGNEHGAATTYHQLGMVSQARRDFASAEQWYKKSLAIEERQGNEHGAAQTYHQLGRVSEERRDFATAEQWYKKSLEVKERQGNEHGAATTYGQLGLLSAEMEQWIRAGERFLRCLASFAATNDRENVNRTVSNFTHRAFLPASPDERKTLRAMWVDAGLPASLLDDALANESSPTE